jgi:hypothetical protein
MTGMITVGRSVAWTGRDHADEFSSGPSVGLLTRVPHREQKAASDAT